MNKRAASNLRTLSTDSQRSSGRAVKNAGRDSTGQRGMALIGVLLIMSLLLMLGLAVTFSAVTDSSVTANFKNVTSGFYAAEAGINNLHRVLRSNQFVLASLPNPPVIVAGQPTLNQGNFVTAAQQALNQREAFPNNAAYKTSVAITNFQAPFPTNDGDPAHAWNRVQLLNPLYPNLGQIETYVVSYKMQSVGEGISGLNGLVTLVEEGVLNFKLLVQGSGGGLRVGTFSEFALFLDHFDPYNPVAPFIYQGFGPGDRFTGRVHSNERLGFWTPADGSDAPVFHGYVTQAYRDASYYRYGAGNPPPPVDANSEVVDGVLVAPQFLAGFDRGVQAIPPVGNAFDQARAVLDGGYALSAGPPTDGDLHTGLRLASDLGAPLAEPKDPTSTTPTLAKGVYVPSDGENFSGSGLYVMGSVDEMTLSADPSGNREIIRIRQGLQITTVVINIDAGTTTIDAGNGTTTLRGVPKDRSIVQQGNRSAASLYVYGDINSLHGPGRDNSGQPIPAIDSNFAMTVTAGGVPNPSGTTPVTGGNVTITGDLVYETPVVDASGNPINQDAGNLLGIYASGGNIIVPEDGRAPNNVTVNASMAAFQLKNPDGSPIVGPDGRAFGGRIKGDLTDWPTGPNRGNFNLVGGAQSSNYDNMGVYDGSMIHGYLYKGIWDHRYDQGQKAPPFYPGYVVDAGGPTGVPKVSAQTNSPTILSYKRFYYGTGTNAGNL